MVLQKSSRESQMDAAITSSYEQNYPMPPVALQIEARKGIEKVICTLLDSSLRIASFTIRTAPLGLYIDIEAFATCRNNQKEESSMSLSHIPAVASTLVHELGLDEITKAKEELHKIMESWRVTANAVGGRPIASLEFRLASEALQRVAALEQIMKGTFKVPSLPGADSESFG